MIPATVATRFKQAQPFVVEQEETAISTIVPPPRPAERALELALAAARTAHENRGRDIVVLDMRELTTMCDYFLIVSGTSRRQLHAISEEIDHCLEDDMGDHRQGIEGYQDSGWILLDYGSLVVHIFEDELREYFDLENLWAGAKHVPLPFIDEPSDPPQ